MPTTVTLEHGVVENLAYSLWEERRRPFGSPEIDWFCAEAILTYRVLHPVLPSSLADAMTSRLRRRLRMPDMLIEYLPSLLGEAIKLYSCFVSYSADD
jgi:hypothetical protein